MFSRASWGICDVWFVTSLIVISSANITVGLLGGIVVSSRYLTVRYVWLNMKIVFIGTLYVLFIIYMTLRPFHEYNRTLAPISFRLMISLYEISSSIGYADLVISII